MSEFGTGDFGSAEFGDMQINLILNRLFPIALNSAKLVYFSITLPIYSDSECTTLDSALGELTTGQVNIANKWIYNNTSIPIAVQIKPYKIKKVTKEKIHFTTNEMAISWDGVTYDSSRHLVDSDEKHSIKIRVSDINIFVDAESIGFDQNARAVV